ncbi:MAG: HAMP domain-containing histidine kinase [Defluviitaleaceae bacterium]|nr:HAMP domain-containing histidine kinase [Defluviitaleaceae bacterium]
MPIFFFANNTLLSIENYFMNQRENQLIRVANITANRIFRENYILDPSKYTNFRNTVLQRSEDEGLRIIILDTMSNVLVDSEGIEENNTLFLPEIINTMATLSPTSVIQSAGTIRYTVVPINNELSEMIGIVLLISSVQDINELIEVVSSQTETLSLISLIFAILSALIVAYIVLSPLMRLLRAVERMSSGYLSERIKIIGKDEFAKLCKEFNLMNDKLERIEKTREEFVSNVSHELKTPISSIKVLSDSILIQENIPNEIYKEFLEDISKEVDRMNNIINDLLTLVKLDQNTTFLNISKFNINDTIKNIIKRLKPLADQKNIIIDLKEEKEIFMQGDEMKLALAISNLIENAIKYTKETGFVYVKIDGDNQNIYISVKDTGIGIAEEEYSKIFNRFYRVDKTRDRDTGGTGLGLSITHSTILLHNGTIRVNSKENEGTSFLVRLPI